ncbi:MAG: hypothetical protein Fur003_3780 [Candidatus Dojkabacteria bacterium]
MNYELTGLEKTENIYKEVQAHSLKAIYESALEVMKFDPNIEAFSIDFKNLQNPELEGQIIEHLYRSLFNMSDFSVVAAAKVREEKPELDRNLTNLVRPFGSILQQNVFELRLCGLTVLEPYTVTEAKLVQAIALSIDNTFGRSASYEGISVSPTPKSLTQAERIMMLVSSEFLYNRFNVENIGNMGFYGLIDKVLNVIAVNAHIKAEDLTPAFIAHALLGESHTIDYSQLFNLYPDLFRSLNNFDLETDNDKVARMYIYADLYGMIDRFLIEYSAIQGYNTEAVIYAIYRRLTGDLMRIKYPSLNNNESELRYKTHLAAKFILEWILNKVLDSLLVNI